MTTIAAHVDPRNGSAAIAADGIYCSGTEIQSYTYRKIIRLGDSVVAGAGYARLFDMIDRFELISPGEFVGKLQEVMGANDVQPENESRAHPPAYPNCWFFMSIEGLIWEISQTLDIFQLSGSPSAIGTGSEYAVAAMESMITLGSDATPEEIVRHGVAIASKRDVFLWRGYDAVNQ